MEKEIFKKIIEEKLLDFENLEKIKRSAAKKHKGHSLSNRFLLEAYRKKSLKEKKEIFKSCGNKFTWRKDAEIKKILTTRPVRSLSGIVNISVLTKPYPCPGKCIFCPQEKGMPKSYLKNEPAAMRAFANKYNPEKQIKTRIKSLKLSGHPVDKIELKIIGGTWDFYPKKYREWFIKECFRSCNFSKSKSRSLEEEQKRNEKAKHRIVDLSIETRPDFVNKEEIQELRRFGVTSIELGVQSIYDDVLKKIKRGHLVSETIQATKILKDSGLRICYHVMLNLPGSNIKKDKDVFKNLFLNSDFQPDHLKIYPMAIIKKTAAYNLWLNKKYKPYSDSQLKNLLKEIKKKIPQYVRIQRIIRDIPAQNIEAGTKISNLRQIIERESTQEGWRCLCIRCREIKNEYVLGKRLKISRINYESSGGEEVFLSFDSQDGKKIYSLLRLRVPCNPFIPALKNSAIIREIHTYGQQIAIGEKGKSPQHRGLGKKLIKEAEKIAQNEFNVKKISVTSAVGARNYYRRLGYRKNGTYMIKIL